jgi:glutathione S-transferase
VSRPVLVIGNRNYSSWSLRPWLVLTHFGIDFDEERISLDEPETEARIRERSPSGRVPALIDAGLTVWDSLAICEYANERWLAGAGWPVGRQARAVARSVCAEMHAGFTAVREELPMNIRARGRRIQPTGAALADIARVGRLVSDARGRFGDDGPWLFGAFSIADAMYAPVASRFATYGIEAGGTMDEWCATMLGHPAMRAWSEGAAEETEVIAAEERGEADGGGGRRG